MRPRRGESSGSRPSRKGKRLAAAGSQRSTGDRTQGHQDQRTRGEVVQKLQLWSSEVRALPDVSEPWHVSQADAASLVGQLSLL